jgi:membrane-bound lytic murein transglycosylase D
MRFFAAALIFFRVAVAIAQPVVPPSLVFAGITLTIHPDARKEIQDDVDALTRHPRYFEAKADRARQYFPIIERIFAEERVPPEFKYLAIQESALQADAVSVSNAVGFWQFKDFTAREVGLRVDEVVDERRNIVSATRGAARYLKQNNFIFNNWILALQAYQMGAGGVKRLVGNEFDGLRQMHITAGTYWYVKKFLAHWVAFSHALQTPKAVPVFNEKVVQAPRSLQSVADELAVDAGWLAAHNTWLRTGDIPADRPYTVLVPPLPGIGAEQAPAVAATLPTAPTAPPAEAESPTLVYGVAGLVARNETLPRLVQRAGIGLSDFLDFNDIEIDHQPRPGMFYFVEKKNSQAHETQHLLALNEDLWVVAQKYAVQLKKLRKLNRLKNNETLQPGQVVWLSSARPKTPAATPGENVAELDTENWITLTDEPAQQPATHIVQPAETLYSIARQYGVTVQQLMDWNRKKDATLAPGERLWLNQAPAR